MPSAPDNSLAAPAPEEEPAPLPPPRAVERSPRRRRNQVCIGVIAFGLLNFMAYTLMYASLGGDAHNGYRSVATRADGTRQVIYKIRGHHVRILSGQETEVSRATWIYSYVHSISVPLTSGALIICMLILARPHILATMRDSWLSGQTFVRAFGAIVILVSLAAAALFVAHFVAQLGGT